MTKVKRGFWLFVLLLFVVGCNRKLEIRWVEQETATVPPPAPPTLAPPVQPPTATPGAALPATSTPVPIPPTPTPLPPTPVPPTPTLLPPPPTAPAAQAVPNPPGSTRIRFAQGATSAVASGWLPRGGVADYVLRAQAGQGMEVWVQSPGNDVFLTVMGQDGTVYQNVAARQSYWQGTLPYTQDYTLRVVALGGDTNYALRVTIPARIPSGPGGTVYQGGSSIQRIQPEGVEYVGSYVLHAYADQTVDIVLTSPYNNVLLAIHGTDGMPVMREVAGARDWHGRLLTTQDYLIHAVSVGPDPSFSLSVKVSPRGSGGNGGPGPLPAPTPIFFQQGAISGIEYGRLAPGAVQRYELRAMAGQQLVVRVWPERTFGITVEGERSGLWSAPPQVGNLAIPALPATQNYVITLSLPDGYVQAVDYTMEVTIP